MCTKLIKIMIFIINYIQNTVENCKKDIRTSKFDTKKCAYMYKYNIHIYICNFVEKFYMYQN